MFATPEQEPERPPGLVLAHPDAIYAAVASRYLRQCGWEVYLADSGPDARYLARETGALVVALDVGLAEQSGWLTCWKLRHELPGVKVLLVTGHAAPIDHRFAAFVGAAGLVDRRLGVAALVEAVYGAALRAVG
jgi:DNA-binding response OmpR family regulator